MDDRPLPAPRSVASLDGELQRASSYAASALAPATRRAYEQDWRAFADWCAPRGVSAIPAAPATVAAFLASEADREFRPVTIERRAQDHPNPCDSGAVAAVLSGNRRELGTAPMRRAAPLDLDPLARLLEPIEDATLGGRRDRALLLLLGFAAALRRSELVALDVEDLAFGGTAKIRRKPAIAELRDTGAPIEGSNRVPERP